MLDGGKDFREKKSKARCNANLNWMVSKKFTTHFWGYGTEWIEGTFHGNPWRSPHRRKSSLSYPWMEKCFASCVWRSSKRIIWLNRKDWVRSQSWDQRADSNANHVG